MNFEFNEEQKLIREKARRFTDEVITPAAREDDITGSFPMEVVRKMAAEGLLGAMIPEEYGGAGLDYIGDAIILEEISRGSFSLRTIVSVQVSLVEYIIYKWGTEAQKEKYLKGLCKADLIGAFALTEAGSGSDAASLKTTARKEKGNWVLNGSKTWISSGGEADVIIVFARTDPSNGHKGISAFIVEKGAPGFTTKEITGKLGIRSAATSWLLFKNCILPGDALIGVEGEGFRVAMTALDNGRYGVGAGCVGLMDACIEASVDYAKRRKQFGRPIASFQLIQEMIARMVVDRDAARYLVYRAGVLKNMGQKATLETSIAKYFASEAAFRAATDAVQIHGSRGYSNEYPVERYLRDAKVATIYEGTSQIQKLIIGAEILGVKAFL